jgi:membrane protease YdiL (CAAX protease family)
MDVALAVIVIIVGVSTLWHTRSPQSPQALAFGTTFGAILGLQQNRSRYSRGVTPRFRSKASRIPSVVL